MVVVLVAGRGRGAVDLELLVCGCLAHALGVQRPHVPTFDECAGHVSNTFVFAFVVRLSFLSMLISECGGTGGGA